MKRDRISYGARFCYPALLFCRLQESTNTVVEVGPGRGDFLFHIAEKHPDSLIVAIEIKRKRFDKLVKRIEKRDLKNVLLIQADARDIFSKLLKPSSVDIIHINFPDPWPKKKHKKNRLFNDEFASMCENILKPKGSLIFASDSANYVDETVEVFTQRSQLIREELSADKVFPTFFSLKWQSQGRSIQCNSWTKR